MVGKRDARDTQSLRQGRPSETKLILGRTGLLHRA